LFPDPISFPPKTGGGFGVRGGPPGLASRMGRLFTKEILFLRRGFEKFEDDDFSLQWPLELLSIGSALPGGCHGYEE